MLTTTETPPDSDEKREGWKVTPSRILAILAGLAVVGTLIFWWLGSLPEEPHFDIGRPIFGNIPALIVALFYVTIATFLGVMFYLFAQRARSWERGLWESRSGIWKQRLIGFRDALLMRTASEGSCTLNRSMGSSAPTTRAAYTRVLITLLSRTSSPFHRGWSASVSCAGLDKKWVLSVALLGHAVLFPASAVSVPVSSVRMVPL